MMRKIIDAVLFYIAVGLGMFAAAQAPQIPLTGTVGPGGNFAFRNASPVSMTSDANHTMVYPEGSGAFVRVTSTVSLSATRNVIEPFLTNAQCFENSTTGGQAIQIVGASGTGVTIPNGSYACVQGDGTNYHAPNVSDLPLFAPSVVTGNPSAGAIAALPSGSHGSVCDESSTSGVPAAGVDYSRCDSTTHRILDSYNNGAEAPRALVPAVGTSGHLAVFKTNGIDLQDGGAVPSGGINQLTGDVTAGPGTGSQSATLATVNGSPGACGDATHVCRVTTNGKGLTTAQGQVAITASAAVPIITIAPSDSPTPNASSATVVLAGTADQTAINTAIDTYCLANNTPGTVPGCTLQFLYGHIHLTGSININRSQMTIACQGFTTYGSVPNQVSYGGCQFVADNATGAFPLFTVTTTTACLGPNGVTDNRCRGITLKNVYGVCFASTQTGFSDANNTDNEKIEDNTFQGCGVGINTSGDSPDIGGNNLQFNTAAIIAGGVHPNIHNNLIFDNSGAGVQCGNYCIVSNNTIGDSGGVGVTVNGNAIVSGNTFTNPSVQSIETNTNANNVVISGNTFYFQASGTADTILIANTCIACSITNNTGYVSNSGATQTGFFINLNQTVGSGTQYSTVANNAVVGPYGSTLDPSVYFTSSVYNFGTVAQNNGNSISQNVGDEANGTDSLWQAITLATSGGGFNSPTRTLAATCWNGSASVPCGVTMQARALGAGTVGSSMHFTPTTGATNGSVMFDMPDGIAVGSVNPVLIDAGGGGNVQLGTSSALFSGAGGGQGYGVFSSGVASLYGITIIDFGAGQAGDHSTIDRTAPHTWCFGDGGSPTSCTGTVNAANYGSGTLANGMTATTQSPGDNTTKVATDAFVLANSFSNPMTTVGDIIYGGASGVATRLAGASTNGLFLPTANVVASTPVAPTWSNFTNLPLTTASSPGLAPSASVIGNPITSATGGAGTGTVTCVTATCTNVRGSYTVAGGTFATGNLLVLVWPTTTTAFACSATVVNDATGASIGYHSVATATGMNITSLTTAVGLTVDIDYRCSP